MITADHFGTGQFAPSPETAFALGARTSEASSPLPDRGRLRQRGAAPVATHRRSKRSAGPEPLAMGDAQRLATGGTSVDVPLAEPELRTTPPRRANSSSFYLVKRRLAVGTQRHKVNRLSDNRHGKLLRWTRPVPPGYRLRGVAPSQWRPGSLFPRWRTPRNTCQLPRVGKCIGGVLGMDQPTPAS